MNVYYEFWDICRGVSSWEEFLERVSSKKAKWAFLEILEAGWSNQLRTDLIQKFDAPSEEVNELILRYQSTIDATAAHTSAEELATEFMERVAQVNVLRGYLRFANYTKCDDPEDILWTLDEELTLLGSGTPTRDECARSYSIVTGRTVHTGGLVIAGKTADRIATYLAAQIEELQQHLAHTDERKKVIAEMNSIDELHSILTGKRLLGSNLPRS